MISGCYPICFPFVIDVDNNPTRGGGEGEPNGLEVSLAHPSNGVGLADALVVVAFASLVCSFGVTASRRSGCASRVPEDSSDISAVLINSSLIKGF